ncbi:MAG: hypothetical protein ACOC00_03280 [Halothiobacillaceae bacterium]
MNPEPSDQDTPEPGPVKPAERSGNDAIGRASKWMMIVGIVLTAIGMIFGMGGMMLGYTDTAVVDLIMIVPGGFLMTFAGLTGWILSGGR